MKKNLLKITSLITVFAFGLGLVINSQKEPVKVSAEQHTANYANYTYSGNYYNSLNTNGSDGINGTFQSALSSYVFPKGWYTYGSSGADHLSTQLQYADEDPTNSSNMVYLYTRDSVKKNAASSWNREHVWPQSLSSNNWGTGKAGTDILHIRPTYNKTNSVRGNDLYGEVSSGTTLTYEGMTYGKNSGSYFEPLDSVKGDVARIIMYVYTTYNSYYNNSLKITNVFASYDTLLKWHTNDKPDALEGLRNDYCETSKQKNRNPFVDHPEYAWRIYGDSCSTAIKNACKEAYPGEGGGSVTPEKTLVSLSISGTATKSSYYVGETFDPTGLTVTATYDDSSTQTIPNNSCTWSPNPLTLGTTTITCKYSDLTTTYTGVTVNEREVPVDDSYSIVFKNNQDDGNGIISGDDILDEATENTLVDSVTDSTRIYAGKSGLKLGSGSGIGSITFALNEEAKRNISSIKIESEQYRTDDTDLVLYLDSTVIDDEIPVGEEYVKSLEGASANTITIATTSKRAYLSSITLEYRANEHIHTFATTYSYNETTHWFAAACEHDVKSNEAPHSFVDTVVPANKQSGGYTIHTCSVCGYSYKDSYTPKIELIALSVTDNKAGTGYLVGEQLDLTVMAMYSNQTAEAIVDYEVTGFNNQLLGNQTITVKYNKLETQLTVVVVESYEGNEPSGNTSEEPYTPRTNPENKKGCSGSVIGTASFAALSGLIATIGLFIKRKQY